MEYLFYLIEAILIIVIAYAIARVILSIINPKSKPSGRQSSWEEYKNAQAEIDELEERLSELKGDGNE